MKSRLAATSVGDYALFAGGENNSSFSTYVNAYNTSLTRSTPTSLSQARVELAATNVGDYAIFGGGYSTSVGASSTTDVYNTSLTRSTPTVLSQARYALAAASIGNYALFGGGKTLYSSGFLDTVDALFFSINLTLFPGTKYKLNDMVDEQTSSTFQTISVSAPLNGYLKIQNAEIN